MLELVKNKFLNCYRTGYYATLCPQEICELYHELKSYLNNTTYSLNDLEYISLMDLLFHLSCFMGKDIECELIYKMLYDKFGANSPKLHWMKATLLQINQGDDHAKVYLNDLLDNVLEVDTDPVDYLLMSKKLLSIKHKELNKADWVSELLKLIEKFPLDGELWWVISMEYYSSGLFDQCVYCLEEILLISPFTYTVFAQIGEVLYFKSLKMNHTDKDTLKQSLNNCLRAVELSETCLKAWCIIAKISEILSNNRLLELSKIKLNKITMLENDLDAEIAKIVLNSLKN